MHSPLQLIDHPVANAAGLKWYVKRDDRYSPRPGDPYQGNKVRKLKGLEPILSAIPKLITFGGAFSNHLAAAAAFGQRKGIATVGIVRGEPVQNAVLDYCTRQGMHLHFVSRTAYRLKNEKVDREAYLQLLGPGHFINEGGSGPHAFLGTSEILPEIVDQLGQLPDYLQLAAGTGGTAAGVIHSSLTTATPDQGRNGLAVEVFPVLKGNWMRAEISKLLAATGAVASTMDQSNWRIVSDYHFGGYAKRPSELLEFVNRFIEETGIPIEPIYTGKLFFGVLDRIKRGAYPPGSTLVTYHSGGIIAWPT